METTQDYAIRTAAHYLGINLEDAQDVYEAAVDYDGPTLKSVGDRVGIDPMTIIAIIEILMTVVPLVIEWCNAPEKLVRQSRIRNKIAVRIFRIRVYSALRTAVTLEDFDGFQASPAAARRMADAMMDVAHSNGEEYIQSVVNEYRQL